MNNRVGQARRLGRGLVAGWRPEDVEAQLASLHVRQRRHRRRRALLVPLVGGALAAVIALAAGSLRGEAPVVARPEVVVGPAPELAVEPAPGPVLVAPAAEQAGRELGVPPGALSLGDGSIVVPLGTDSRLVARGVSETEVRVDLAGSGARFEVPEHKARRFRADVGALALETHGAVFRVTVTQRQVEVAAERGEITARWGHERRVVAAGETRAFAVVHGGPAYDGHDEPPLPEPPRSWRDDAARGDYDAAWTAITQLPVPLDTMEDLLLAGDVARLSGHAGAAVAPLSRAVALHPQDPRAPLAAFSLGRVHLEKLGAPRDAAQAFARARELAPDGPLAEDALAREVEAWSRAGEAELARQRAVSYARRYPDGRRARAVKHFGGLEGP
jgi:transmembrane sensor